MPVATVMTHVPKVMAAAPDDAGDVNAGKCLRSTDVSTAKQEAGSGGMTKEKARCAGFFNKETGTVR